MQGPPIPNKTHRVPPTPNKTHRVPPTSNIRLLYRGTPRLNTARAPTRATATAP
jgi:hypothetical protein